MAYGRKVIPPPATPFEDFMATTSERMIAAKIDFIEFLRELPPAAWIAIGVVILVLAASSLNLRGKKKSAADTAAVAPAADAVADVAAPAKPEEAAEKVDAVAEKLGVDAPPVSMEVIDQAAELTKGKVAEGGAKTNEAVKAAVGPAQ